MGRFRQEQQQEYSRLRALIFNKTITKTTKTGIASSIYLEAIPVFNTRPRPTNDASQKPLLPAFDLVFQFSSAVHQRVVHHSLVE